MKRFIAVALAVLLAISLLPASALAVDGTIVVDTVEDTVDASDGVTSLREAIVSGWDKIAFHDDLKGATITLNSPLRIGDKVALELSRQTITAKYDTESTLATLWIMDGGALTLRGEGTVTAAEAKDPNKKPTPFALYVKEGGKLTVEGKVAVTGGETSYLIALERRTALTLTTEKNISGGAFGVKAMNTANDYSVTIDMKGEISSDVAMSLTDGPSVSIKQATLKAEKSALIAERKLSELTADGYQVFVGDLDTPATADQMAAAPAEDVTVYYFRKGTAPTPSPEPSEEPTPEPSEEPAPEPVMYTVTYTDGQGHILSSETIEAGKSAIPFSVSDESFTLVHWVDEDGNIYPVGTPFVVNADVTLIAVWEEIKPTTYTVTFNTDGGSPVESQTAEAGKSITLPTTSRDGFNFLHWKDDNGTYAAGSAFVVNADVTLTAVWEEIKPTTYTVTFNTDGGSAVEPQTAEAGASITLPTTSRDGFNFLHWKDDNGTYAAGSAFTVNADVTLTAVWAVKTYTVNFVDGQGNTLHTETVEHGKAAKGYTGTPSREGYTFKGWDKELPAAITADITLTAQWEVTTPTITHRDPQRISAAEAKIFFTSSKAGTYHYVVYKTGDKVPSADTVAASVAQGPCTTSETTISLNSISDDKARDVYVIVVDSSGHRSEVHKIVLPAYAAPTYTVTLPKGTGYTVSATGGSTSPVNAGGSYSFTVSIANGYARGNNFAVKSNGVTVGAYNGVYTISNINANQSVTVTGVVVNQNTGGGGGSYGTLPTQPTITTSLLPSATMGQEYKQQLTATGANPITWSYTGTLPEGITLNTATGLLSGTPTAEGSFRIAVKATNAGGTYTRQLTLVVVGSEYTITEGNNAEWSQGSGSGLSFQGSGSAGFSVRIDGSAVPDKDLTTSADGKTVTVSPDYLETLSTGSHTLTLVYADGNAKAKFNIKSQDRTIPPSITAQPMSATVNEGSAATFSVTASGTTPLLCQWQVDKQDGNGWTDIVGAVSASYTVDEVAAEQNGWLYRCVITNTSGKGESNPATLTVKEAIGDITADTEAPARSNIGRILLFSALGVAAVGLAVGLVIYFRRRDDTME